MSTTTLYYIHDPMCSWCWGFKANWQRLQQQLPQQIQIQYVLGGLAPDTDLPMPADMQINIRDTWRSIQQEIPGTEFNFDFWEQCLPRRSTYPACRAVIAARLQHREEEMVTAIQQAYYCQAKNPSNNDVLLNCARQLGLDMEQFSRDFHSQQVADIFRREMDFCRQQAVFSFPSLLLKHDDEYYPIDIDYRQTAPILKQISDIIGPNETDE